MSVVCWRGADFGSCLGLTRPPPPLRHGRPGLAVTGSSTTTGNCNYFLFSALFIPPHYSADSPRCKHNRIPNHGPQTTARPVSPRVGTLARRPPDRDESVSPTWFENNEVTLMGRPPVNAFNDEHVGSSLLARHTDLPAQ